MAGPTKPVLCDRNPCEAGEWGRETKCEPNAIPRGNPEERRTSRSELEPATARLVYTTPSLDATDESLGNRAADHFDRRVVGALKHDAAVTLRGVSAAPL